MNSWHFSYCELFDESLEFTENEILNIVVENRLAYRRLIEELLHKKAGDDSSVVISENLEEINFKNVDILCDVFSLSLNNKSFTSALLTQFEKIVCDEELSVDAMELISLIEKLFIKISDNLGYEIEFSDTVSFKDLAKIYGVHFEEKSPDIVENVMKYVQISTGLLRTKVFIFFNLKAFFSKEEIDLMYKFFIYNKIPVIIIQSEVYFKNDREKLIVIDDDLCCI